MRMFGSVSNCARTPPMLLPVAPRPCSVSRASMSTPPQPARARCQAMLAPTIPAPAITTFAVFMPAPFYTRLGGAAVVQCAPWDRGDPRTPDAEHARPRPPHGDLPAASAADLAPAAGIPRPHPPLRRAPLRHPPAVQRGRPREDPAGDRDPVRVGPGRAAGGAGAEAALAAHAAHGRRPAAQPRAARHRPAGHLLARRELDSRRRAHLRPDAGVHPWRGRRGARPEGPPL